METSPTKKFSALIKNNLYRIAIIVVSILYISQGVFTLVVKTKNITEVLGNITLSFTVGLIIAACMKSMGLKDGRDSNLFKQSKDTFVKTKEQATPYFDKLQAWCDYKNDIELNSFKKNIIKESGLKWEPYRLGYYDTNSTNLSKEQLLALEKVKNVKLPKLTVSELLVEIPDFSSSAYKKSKFGESIKHYSQRNFISDIFSKFTIGIICGMFGLAPIITGDNLTDILANVIWNSMQIVIWLSLGVLKYSGAYAFIVDEYRQTHIIQKTEYLNEFIITVQNSPDQINSYDDDDDINKYVESIMANKNKK